MDGRTAASGGGSSCRIADIVSADESRWKGRFPERNGSVSLVTARCLGACGLAPAVVFDGEVAGKIGVEATLERVKPWSEEAAPETAGLGTVGQP